MSKIFHTERCARQIDVIAEKLIDLLERNKIRMCGLLGFAQGHDRDYPALRDRLIRWRI